MRWADGEVALEDSVEAPQPVSGRHLRDAFFAGLSSLTLGLVRPRGEALWLGPVEVLRFGMPAVSGHAVEWPIEGGVATRAAAGTLRIESARGRLVASVDGYRPRLPPAVYVLTQLPFHHTITRLQLLRMRGREPAPGIPVARRERLRSATVDLAFCALLARVAAPRHRAQMTLSVAAAYHVACWSISGRTLGGLVTGQRVVAVDGTRPSAGQALVRWLSLPAYWLTGRAIHDEVAGTDVIAG